MNFHRIGVLGGGAWGTALALTCARAARDVLLWEFDAANAEHLSGTRESLFLPGVKLDERIKVTRDLGETARAEAVLRLQHRRRHSRCHGPGRKQASGDQQGGNRA